MAGVAERGQHAHPPTGHCVPERRTRLFPTFFSANSKPKHAYANQRHKQPASATRSRRKITFHDLYSAPPLWHTARIFYSALVLLHFTSDSGALFSNNLQLVSPKRQGMRINHGRASTTTPLTQLTSGQPTCLMH
jgi:hypothetical protein